MTDSSLEKQVKVLEIENKELKSKISFLSGADGISSESGTVLNQKMKQFERELKESQDKAKKYEDKYQKMSTQYMELSNKCRELETQLNASKNK